MAGSESEDQIISSSARKYEMTTSFDCFSGILIEKPTTGKRKEVHMGGKVELLAWTKYCFSRQAFIIKKNLTTPMRADKRKQVGNFEDPENNLQCIYDPLSSESDEQYSRIRLKSSGDRFRGNLFDLADQVTLKEQHEGEKKIRKDNLLSKIISNTKNPKRIKSKNNQENQDSPFCFNAKLKVAYPQTPGFKSLLLSPFGKFNSLHQEIINALSKEPKQKDTKQSGFQPLDPTTTPFYYFDPKKGDFSPARFFIGISMYLKEQECISESIYFCNLACYADPYSEKAWKKYIAMEEDQGHLNKACILSKTGFLFTQTEETAKLFLTNGEKCGYPILSLQGLLCSVSNPEALERNILPQSAKMQIKYGTSWKGLKVLYQICKSHDYKLAVCSIILFTAKYLQNIGYPDEAIKMLQRSFHRSMTKLQIYTMFLQMSIRRHQTARERDIQEVMKHVDNISGENRFRLYLEVGEILYKNNDERFFAFIRKAYEAAEEFCSVGAGANKAFKQIYFNLIKMKGLPPNVHSLTDHVIFQKNRHHFINGEPLIEHEFTDWKYYLHYGVTKNYELLSVASKKWPLTGRLIAEWVHCLRALKTPMQMLKVWRKKIDEVPKSGELWCEGGRIYAQLGELSNASKCFKYAIHFTPQYGDSFIEELRLLLRESRYHQIEKLRKLFFVSEPFYGHVLSYLKLNHDTNSKLSMNQIWQSATEQINADLYRPAQKRAKSLTAYPPYNKAYLEGTTRRQKQLLFASYQQMENKN